MEVAGVIVLRDFIQKSPIIPPAVVLYPGATAHFSEVKTEAIRKSIHFLIALCPGIAALNYHAIVLLLMAGILGYTVMEFMRLAGKKVPVVSAITSMASRRRDMNRLVLGPVTLGLGAVFSLLFFPPVVASIAIYALAFGDGLASLAGKMFGKIRPAFLYGKSIEGSIACFVSVFTVTWFVSRSFVVSLDAAITAAAVEALPLEDYDNIALPLAVGMVVALIM